MDIYRKKSNVLKYIFIMLLLIIITGVGFLFVSPTFEQNKPIITFNNGNYWNLKDKLSINIKDQSGVKYYKVTFIDGSKETVLQERILQTIDKNLNLEVNPPKLDMFYKGGDVKIKVEAIDNSKWNFFNGNAISKIFNITIDNKLPLANVIGNSRYIARGGSAVVVVKVKDENLKEAYISFNDKTKFILTPFYKQDYFIALIAWDINIEHFKRVNLIAIDKANNKTIRKIPFYIQNARIKKDNITITESFINNVSSSVLEQSNMKVPTDLVDRFLKENNELRIKNIKFLRDLGIKTVPKTQIDNFSIKPFKRLRGSRTAAGYAERRSYYFQGEKIDEQWHLGMDWASVKQATIRISNKGTVVFNDYLGIYGNTIIVNHALGLMSLYAHTSSTTVQLNQEVKARQKIANTGSTGAVMGDHLHFGILIQGIEVNPLEWMDKYWIKTRITDIIKQSKNIIDGK